MKQGYVLLLHENCLGDSLILLALKNEDILVGKLIATCTSDYKSSWLHLQQIRNKYYLTKIPSLFLEFSLKLKLGQYIFLATSRLCENRYSQLKLCIPNQLTFQKRTCTSYHRARESFAKLNLLSVGSYHQILCSRLEQQYREL